MKRIAIDLGASNGRVVVCETGGGNIADTMDIVHRFPSHTVELPTGLHWNLPGIYEEIITGLGLAVEKYGVEIASAAIDSWGVDYSLIDGKGQLMFLPYHYRDEHTDGIPERVFAEIIPRTRTLQDHRRADHAAQYNIPALCGEKRSSRDSGFG
jgi:rhamnulokinase